LFGAIGFDRRAADLAITAEGVVAASSLQGLGAQRTSERA
jgi:hypothetical protein